MKSHEKENIFVVCFAIGFLIGNRKILPITLSSIQYRNGKKLFQIV